MRLLVALSLLVLVGSASVAQSLPVPTGTDGQGPASEQPTALPALEPGPRLGRAHADDSQGTMEAAVPAMPSPAATAAPGTKAAPRTPSATSAAASPVQPPAPHLPLDTATPLTPPPGGVAPITFVCPEVTAQAVATMQTNGDRIVPGCPIRVYDDTYTFGNTQLAVNPYDATQLAFATLHGFAERGGPHDYSRGGQTHTVFTSEHQGTVWMDQPINGAPNGGYGETSDIVMDTEGHIYFGYLWSRPTGNATLYGSTVGLYKADSPDQGNSVYEAYDTGTAIQDRSGSNPITNLGLAYAPPKRPPLLDPDENVTVEEPPAEPEEYGETAIPSGDPGKQRIVAVWHERAADWENDDLPYATWIDAAITDTTSNNTWIRLGDGIDESGRLDANETVELIGPCMDSSNPVVFDGMVYVACVADRGYDAGGKRDRARIGQIDIWKINPLTGTTHWVEYTGMTGGHPILASNPDGYMMMLTHRFDPESRMPFVQMASGWFGEQWEVFNADFGPELHRLGASNRPLIDAHVTALAISQQERTGILLYKEWQEPVDGFVPEMPDPMDPGGSIYSKITDFNKVVMTFNSCDGPVAAHRLDMGSAVDPTNVQAYTERPGVFNDIQDGLEWFLEPTGGEVFYMAASDYGSMQFAGINVGSHSTTCAVPMPILNPPPVPVPQALGVATGANLMVAAGAGVAATAMVAYLLTVKRKLPIFTAAEDK